LGPETLPASACSSCGGAALVSLQRGLFSFSAGSSNSAHLCRSFSHVPHNPLLTRSPSWLPYAASSPREWTPQSFSIPPLQSLQARRLSRSPSCQSSSCSGQLMAPSLLTLFTGTSQRYCGSVPEHCNKGSVARKRVQRICWFPSAQTSFVFTEL